jgi:hypothetical protein
MRAADGMRDPTRNPRRRRARVPSVLGLIASVALVSSAPGACIPYTEAPNRVGESVCVSGKVVRVEENPDGTWLLDFCADNAKCPFTAVVLAQDLREVGDVRRLAGETLELFGKVKLYRGQAEIILKDGRQLHGEAAKLPPMPKEYDASRHGHFSAGKYRKKGKPADLAPDNDAEKR